MGAINGEVSWGQVMLWYTGAGYMMQDQQYSFSGGYVVSVNSPIIFQIVWTDVSGDVTDGLNEQYVAQNEGDIVNIIFHVIGTTEYPLPAFSEWDTLATIRKSKDLPNRNMATGTTPNSQSFTIDISRICQDQLSYSLVPIGKGSWEGSEFGGMNGGPIVQDNITETVSPYNLSRNGMYRTIEVHCTIEMLDANGAIEESTTTKGSTLALRVINSAPQFNESTYYNSQYIVQKWGVSVSSQKRALTNSPHETVNTTDGLPEMLRKVHLDDQAEWLYFYIKEAYDGNDNSDYYNVYEMFGETFNSAGVKLDGFVLGSVWPYPIANDPTNMGTRIMSDMSHDFTYHTGTDTQFQQAQSKMAVQNVSPGYINNHAYPPQNANYPYAGAQFSPIDSNVDYYRVYVRGVYYSQLDTEWKTQRRTNVYYYKVDHKYEQKGPYEKVKFHWLNTMGGIDSYTATRDVVEGISIAKSLITTPLPNRRYHQDDTDNTGTTLDRWAYYSDTMRGFDTYKGGKEVLNVEANVNNKVYTEPLNNVESTWLREMFTSPNVWVETPSKGESSSDASYYMERYNDILRPELNKYTPVIITNSDIVSLNQEGGLVKFNIEYTLAQGVVTQRN
tara:strand:- start:4267 stop:6111 length:1845 start_codon:yes stop_codon:yes gene_type:complete